MSTALEAKNKGNEAFTNKKYDEAVNWFSEAIKLDPSNHVLYSNRSGAFAALGKYNDALSDANKTIELKADWPKGYSRKGTALHGLRQYDEAENAYKKGLELEPANVQMKESLDEVRKAKMQGQQRGEPNIGEIFGQAFSGDIWTKLRSNPQTAVLLSQPDFVQKLTEIQQNPQNISKHLQDKRVMSALGVLMGVNIQQPDFPEEEELPKKEQAKEAAKPKQEEKKETTPMEVEKTESQKQAEELKLKGNDAYKNKKFDEAIKYYSDALAIEPTNITFLTNRAAAFFEKGDYESCNKDCQTAIDEGRAQRADYKLIAKAYTRMGNAYMKLKQYKEAIDAYNHALTEDRTPQTLELLRKAEKIKEETDRQSYIDPQKSTEAKERGNEFFRQGLFPEAVKEYTEAIKRNPDDYTLYSNRAAAYTKLAAYQEGLKDSDECIRRNPTFVKGYTRKGHILFFMKEYQKALHAYDEGLKLDENNQELVDGVKRAIAAMQEEGKGESDKDRLEKAMQNPEVQEILSDPVMRQILQDMQTNPEAAKDHLKSPLIAQKIEKLINAGVLRVG